MARTALVVGGTSGIGAATALRLAADGATVLVAGLNPVWKRGNQVLRLASGDVLQKLELRVVVKDRQNRLGATSLLR